MVVYNHPLSIARNLSVTDSDYTDAHDRAVAEGAGSGSPSYIGQQDGYFYIYRLGIWFEPYSLPEGATLTGIRLKLYAYKYKQAGKDNSYNFYLQVRKTPALEDGTLEESKSDYPKMLGGTFIAQEAASNFATYLEGYTYHYINIPLTYGEDELPTVDLTGTTILSLISSKDKFATEPDAGTSEKLAMVASPDRMFLELTYTLADARVTTNTATLVTGVSAILNGTLSYDGGKDCAVSFEWGLTTSYGEITAEETKNTGETFSAGITELVPGTTYHFRAKAVNSYGTFYGADRTFRSSGSIYPSVSTTRVSSLVHRWTPGSFTLEMVLGGITSEFDLIIPTGKPTPTIPMVPTVPTLPSCQSDEMLTWSLERGYYCMKISDIPPGKY